MIRKNPPTQFEYIKFALISACGFMIATALLWAGVRLAGLSVFMANFLADWVAVTFVFLLSASRTLSVRDRAMMSSYAVYLLWQVAHISVASMVVAEISQWPSTYAISAGSVAVELISKVLVTPVTVTMNFIVARLLFGRI